MRRLLAQRDGWRAIGDQVDPEELQWEQRQWVAGDDRGQQRQDLAAVGAEKVDHDAADVGKDRSPLLHRADDGGEVVIGEDHLARLFGHVGAGDSHRHADISAFERGRIVHPIARHRNNMPERLQRLHDAQLMPGLGARARGDSLDTRL